MGVYQRKLKKRGWRWYYRGSYLGTLYHSQAIYLTKKEASQAERDRLADIENRIKNPHPQMTLKNLMNLRLDYLELNKSEHHYRESKRVFKKFLDFKGEVDAEEVKRKDINDFLMAEAKRYHELKQTNHKVNSALRLLKALFNYGIKYYDLELINPCFGVDFYPIDIKLKYIPTPEEIKKIRDGLNAKQKELFDFVDETGCRVGEALRFKPEHIDGNLITLWTRKAKNSNLTPRRIPKPNCLTKFKGFKEWTEYPRFLGEATDGKWNWHNLRHRRASVWASQGMTTMEIMTRLGHANIQTTMRYLQLLGFTRT